MVSEDKEGNYSSCYRLQKYLSSYVESQILLLSQSSVSIFQFDPKVIHLQPSLVGSVSLVKDVKYMHVLREGIFSLCYEDSIEIYNIDEVKGTRLTLRKKYELPTGSALKLFQIP